MEQRNGSFLFYQGKEGNINVQVVVGDETVWTTQKGMAEIFNVEASAVSKHINNIYQEAELARDRTISKMELVQKEGNREVKRAVDFYNLDMIIAVGYRVNSYQATQFRIWANKILKEYLIKGFSIDDERLKQAKQLFGKDYFDELLERIREIRASERRFYQKITDIYALSVDYDKSAPITRKFFAGVQNKLEYAITKQTAAEIIMDRADAKKPHMGLQTWRNSPDGKILKLDVTVAKNYLNEAEIKELNVVVNMYLDYAELQAKRQVVMKMSDWVGKLDAFLQFNEYSILPDAGKIEKAVADAFAEKQYEEFRVEQDREYLSDFDKLWQSRLEEITVAYRTLSGKGALNQP
ncbi:MAG: virulence RhuM family protein [Flavipsychrobacter sp.]|nr:virulence RhuM family protein [Flavipsychrobacter sp.]